MTLYAEEFLLEFLNKHPQLLLQENKESEDKCAKDANQTHPNQHADPIESISKSDYILVLVGRCSARHVRVLLSVSVFLFVTV